MALFLPFRLAARGAATLRKLFTANTFCHGFVL
jgi:hypothetical protein